MRADRDRGATAVFLAFVLLLLIGVAAVALDLARAWNERRQDQTAADVAAVAGALSLGTNETEIANQVMDAARLNLDTAYEDSDWTAAWASCSGPPPAGFTPANHATLGALDCIGLNPSFIWVRLPEQVVPTTFGKAIGIDSITTRAEATATLLSKGGSGALPFAIRGNASAGELCLDTSTGSKIVPPCDGNESGSFGNIAPPLFGSPSPGSGTSPSCGNQTSANNYVPQSIAMGIDHFIFSFSHSAWVATSWNPDDNTSNNSVDSVANMDECTDTGGFVAEAADGEPINAVYVDTGNSTKADITEGMMTGTGFTDGLDARLTRTAEVNTRTFNTSSHTYKLDNQPLWKFLSSGHGVVGCDPSAFASGTYEEKSDQMRACLEGYAASGSSAQIFSDSILSTPRVGVAPRLWHNNLGSGLSFRPVREFEVVFVNGLFFDDKAQTAFFPGESTDATDLDKFKEIEQATAFLLESTMVSDKVKLELGGLADDLFQPTLFE